MTNGFKIHENYIDLCVQSQVSTCEMFPTQFNVMKMHPVMMNNFGCKILIGFDFFNEQICILIGIVTK